MKPSGVIYSQSKPQSGQVRIALTEKEKKRYRYMRFLGANLSSLAMAFALVTYGPMFEMDMNYFAGMGRANAVEFVPDNQELPRTAHSDNAQELAGDSTGATRKQAPVHQFSVSIPTIGAYANVVKDVDPYDEKAYSDALKYGVAHALGTSKPGEGGRIFLFAHSTNSPLNFSEYNAIFYQLRHLKEGDMVYISLNNDIHSYRVTERVVVSANDTSWLTDTSSDEELVLQTCDPPGTTLRRLLVIAKPVR